MNNYFGLYDPAEAMGQGMALYHGMMQEADDQTKRTMIRKRNNALSAMGDSPYLTGFDGVQGAETSDLRRQIYQTGDPELAMKWEAMASQPFAEDRAIKKAGAIEAEKLQAKENQDNRMWATMPGRMASLMAAIGGGQPGAGGSNVFAQQGWAPPASTGIGTPQGEPAPGSGVMVPQQGFSDRGRALSGGGLAQLNSAQMDVTIDEHGRPQFKLKGPDSLADEVARRKSAIDAMGAETAQGELSERKTRNAAMLADESTQRIEGLLRQRHDLEKSSDVLPPHKIAQGVARIDAEIALAEQRRSGAGPTEPTQLASQAKLTPAEKQKAAAVRQQRQAGPGVWDGINYPAEQRLKAKMKERGLEKDQDTIASAHIDAEKYADHYQTGKDLLQLVATEDIGSLFANIPGGETAMRMWSEKNDRLQKWRNELIDTQKKEGQSQLMNTLPELAIVSDEFPSVTNRPDTNRIAMAKVMNKMDAKLMAPGFLQEWSDQHGGSLKGAREMFREWRKTNNRYTSEERDGKVSIYENDIIPIDAWARLRQRLSAKDIAKAQAAGKLKVLNGRVFLDQ